MQCCRCVFQSQLRNSIVTELQQTARGQGQLSLRDLRVPEEGSLLHRASNSLIADHLRRCQYEYSLSVFLPESGISRDKVGVPDLDVQMICVRKSCPN